MEEKVGYIYSYKEDNDGFKDIVRNRANVNFWKYLGVPYYAGKGWNNGYTNPRCFSPEEGGCDGTMSEKEAYDYIKEHYEGGNEPVDFYGPGFGEYKVAP